MDLAAALMTGGLVALDPKHPFRVFERAGRKWWVFYFQDASECGRFQTDDLIGVWNDGGWMDAHPEHPFAVAWKALAVRNELLKLVKGTPPMVCVEERGAEGYLSANAPEWMVDKFFKRLGEVARRRKRR